MSSPEPVAPSPKKKLHPLLLGCLILIGAAVLLAGAVIAIGVMVAAHEENAKTPAQRQAEHAARARKFAADESARLAPELAEAHAVQARLSKIASGLPAIAAMTTMPCPRVAGESLDFAPIDADLLRNFRDGAPHQESGTAWFEHHVFTELIDEPKSEYYSPENEALAWIEVDRKLAETGHIAVIHTLALKPPHLLKDAGIVSDGSFDPGHFTGWIQLISYPDGKTVCEVPFSADSSDHIGGGISIGLRMRGITIPVTGAGEKPGAQQQLDDDFQSNFWTAAQAAITPAAATH